LLVLDEAFDGLDFKSRDTLREVLRIRYDNPEVDSNGALAVISHHMDDLVISPTHACIVGLGESGTEYSIGEWDSMAAEVETFFDSQRASPPAPALKPQPPKTTPEIRSGEPVVEMKGVSIAYGDRVVFDKLEWTVLEGDKWVVIGGNGSGKSTLLELVTGENMLGYQQPLHLFGKKKGSGESVWELKQKMGVVSTEFHMGYVAAMQDPSGALGASNSAVNTWDIVCSGFFDSVGLYQEVSKAQENIAREWVEQFGLTDLVTPPPRMIADKSMSAARAAEAATDAHKFLHLSHGQQKLVLLCRALVKSPKLLLLDEPTHGLSGDNRDRLFGMLSTLVDAPDVAVVYVTHRQEEIDTLNFENVLRLS